MLLLPVLFPLLGGLILLFTAPKNIKAFCHTVMGLTTLGMAGVALFARETAILAYFPFDIVLAMEIDEISLFFSGVFAIVWWVVLLESFTYPEELTPQFYAFYLAIFGGLLGACYSDNLVSLYLFFELVGLFCFPLVAMDQREASIKASQKYLFYSMGGAFLGLISVIYFTTLDLQISFTPGGVVGLSDQVSPHEMLGFFLLAIIGFGCKAGLFPLHSWLTLADPIAPSPASAVLSGVTTKLGILAMLRLSYYVVGSDLLRATYAQEWGLILALLTIFIGSVLAYRERDLKTRLAYSTVSQVAYIVFALFLFHKLAFVGAMLQMAFHALAKSLLFLCAGQMIAQTGENEAANIQKHPFSPFTGLFAIGSLSLVGIPFTGGFVSKWYMGTGAMAQEMFSTLGVGVLILSAIFTARYLFPLIIGPFFVDPPPPKEEDSQALAIADIQKKGGYAPVLALLLLAAGIYPLPLLNFLFTLAEQLL